MKKIRFIGNIFMLLSLVFIVYKLSNYNVDSTQFFSLNCLKIFLIYVLLLYMFANIYRVIFNVITGKEIFPLKGMHIYLKANLYKYLPGNVFHYVARNQLALNEDVSQADVAFVSVIEAIFLVISSFSCTVILSFNYTVEWFNKNGFPILPIIIVAVGFIAIIVCCLIFKDKLLNYVLKYKRIVTQKNAISFSLCILGNIFVLVSMALLYVMLLHNMGISIPVSQYPKFIGLFSLSWLLGFITPGAPGGMGVREAVMSFFFLDFMPIEIIITSALLFRVICILSEIFAYIISAVLKKIYNVSAIIS